MVNIDERIINKLKEYNQMHLLEYYDTLTGEQKEYLVHQITNIDFNLLELLKKDHTIKKGIIEPINALKRNEIEKQKEEFYESGIQAIKKGKIGAVLLAGGQGTRLGFDKPKGMLNVGIKREYYLFEILVSNLLDVVVKANAWIHLFVMTSEKNHEDTVNFFEKHDYFGYNKEYITFFVQEMAPSVDYQGKIYMEDKWKISMSPNGNGGWFSSMAKCKVLDIIHQAGIEWLNIFSVDNVLQKICDPYFVGATIKSEYPVGSKVIKKVHPNEKVGVMCKENGKPSIVEYYELTDKLIHEKDENGELLYNYGVILNYLFRVKELENILHTNMPVHIVEKKIPYYDITGNTISPQEPNGYKFETLVLDMIHLLDDCLVYEVERNKEFAPIKNKEGVDSLVTARELLLENGVAI